MTKLIKFPELNKEYIHEIEVVEDDCTLRIITDNYLIIFYNEQECCSECTLRYEGELDNFARLLRHLRGKINNMELVYKEASEEELKNENDDSGTWSFLKIQTDQESFDIEWLGISNGCYNEKILFKLYKLEREYNGYEEITNGS